MNYWRFERGSEKVRWRTETVSAIKRTAMEPASGNTVLIIEDERDVVDLLALNLRKAGFATSTAPDGAAGLEKARSEKPSLIILDLMLPKMPGLEVCKILKSDPGTRQVPIMMLTAKAEEIDRQEVTVTSLTSLEPQKHSLCKHDPAGFGLRGRWDQTRR